jgi:hypothetical protein
MLRTISTAVFAVLTGCVATQKPFNQMTAQEHLAAAARENRLADEDFADIRENIPPETLLPSGVFYNYDYAEWALEIPYMYEPGDPFFFTAWPRVVDPNVKYKDPASEHRENALRHERAAAALEGRPSPQPLPPPQPPLLAPDRG